MSHSVAAADLDYTPAKADRSVIAAAVKKEAEQDCCEFPPPPGGHPSITSPSFAAISTPLVAPTAAAGDVTRGVTRALSLYDNLELHPQSSSPSPSSSSSLVVVSSSDDPHVVAHDLSMLSRSSSGFRHSSARMAGTANGRLSSGRAGAAQGGGGALTRSPPGFDSDDPQHQQHQLQHQQPRRSARVAASGGTSARQRSGGGAAGARDAVVEGGAMGGSGAAGTKEPSAAATAAASASGSSTKAKDNAWSWDPRGAKTTTCTVMKQSTKGGHSRPVELTTTVRLNGGRGVVYSSLGRHLESTTRPSSATEFECDDKTSGITRVPEYFCFSDYITTIKHAACTRYSSDGERKNVHAAAKELTKCIKINDVTI